MHLLVGPAKESDAMKSDLHRRLGVLERRICPAHTYARVIVGDGETEHEAVRRIFPDGVPAEYTLIVRRLVGPLTASPA